MGYFTLPPKSQHECTPLEIVDTAIANIKLWKDYEDGEYLLELAICDLEIALLKVKEQKNNGNTNDKV